MGIDYTKHSIKGTLMVLITTNDSRIRLFDFDSLTLIMKFKGVTNLTYPISACFDTDGLRIICPSENGEM